MAKEPRSKTNPRMRTKAEQDWLENPSKYKGGAAGVDVPEVPPKGVPASVVCCGCMNTIKADQAGDYPYCRKIIDGDTP